MCFKALEISNRRLFFKEFILDAIKELFLSIQFKMDEAECYNFSYTTSFDNKSFVNAS